MRMFIARHSYQGLASNTGAMAVDTALSKQPNTPAAIDILHSVVGLAAGSRQRRHTMLEYNTPEGSLCTMDKSTIRL